MEPLHYGNTGKKSNGFYQCPANHNQPMFGSISSFFYEKLAGIKPLKPAYKKIEIKPAMIGDLRFVSSSVKTPYGEVCIDWERNEDEILVSVVIPPNTEAVLLIPGQERKEIGSGNYQLDMLHVRNNKKYSLPFLAGCMTMKNWS